MVYKSLILFRLLSFRFFVHHKRNIWHTENEYFSAMLCIFHIFSCLLLFCFYGFFVPIDFQPKTTGKQHRTIHPCVPTHKHTNTHTPTIISGGNHKQPQLRMATHIQRKKGFKNLEVSIL